MTVIWNMDELLASCKDSFKLTKFQCYLDKIYGTGMTINHGRKHDYLGMDLEFCEDGALEVSMFKYVDNVINKFPEDMGQNHTKLWARCIFSETSPIRGASRAITSHGCTTFISLLESKTGHPNGSCMFDNESQTT